MSFGDTMAVELPGRGYKQKEAPDIVSGQLALKNMCGLNGDQNGGDQSQRAIAQHRSVQ